MRSLAVIPVRGGALPFGGAEAAAEAGGDVLLVGSGCVDAIAQLPADVHSIVALEIGDFAPAAWAAALAEHLDAERVILPASPDGRDLAPRLAARLGRPLLAGATEVRRDRVRLSRRGGMVLEEVPATMACVITLQPGLRGVDAVGPSVTPVVHAPTVAATQIDAVVVAVLPPDASTMDLAEAPRILGGGAGLDSGERFVQLAAVAKALDASMGATRVVTDRGWIGHERQIGTTGVVVDPVLYVNFGISGAVQHTSGLGNPEHIISVNTDPHCPMMAMADLAVVADANAVLDALADRLGVSPASSGASSVGASTGVSHG